MESLVELLIPLARLVVIVLLIILVAIFMIRPLFNYLILNRQIEHQKKLRKEMREAKMYAGIDPSSESLSSETTNSDADDDAASPRSNPTKAALNKLANSDPEKAGQLVQKWLHNDK